MSMAVFLFVPTILFMTIVAPIWLIMHYRSKNRAVKGLGEMEKRELEDLLMTADKLTQRIDNLERILDIDSPQWRQYEQEGQYRSPRATTGDEQ